VEEAFKDEYEIRKRLEGGKYTIMRTPTTPPTPEGPQPSLPPPPPNPWEVFKSLVNSIAEKSGGMVWVKMEVKDRGSADRITRMLSNQGLHQGEQRRRRSWLTVRSHDDQGAQKPLRAALGKRCEEALLHRLFYASSLRTHIKASSTS
jgi:hypothetical protein